ncbi:Subtilisin-like protease 3 [Rhizoctonia solani]|uniref:Subtilisin-like protease 3 n=1 Tax=Rhizoctonia solani TaxID=456999 RepID=A0A8H7I998_9AGAM|nr:Subtilisin-like protease 3 [Rhizoctonia solani]
MSETHDMEAITKAEEEALANMYIVALNSQEDLDAHLDWIKEKSNENLDSDDECTFVRDYGSRYPFIEKGYNVKLGKSIYEEVAKRGEVKFIVKEQLARLDAGPVVSGANINVAPHAPWNLRRLSSRTPLPPNADPSLLIYEYRYRNLANPQPVNVYVQLEVELVSARTSLVGNADVNGHGTHVAGIIGGNQVGVAARNVNIISVKVMGLSTIGSVLSGITWAVGDALASGNPAIINMSLGFDPQLTE